MPGFSGYGRFFSLTIDPEDEDEDEIISAV
jgi:hypothetical protein